MSLLQKLDNNLKDLLASQDQLNNLVFLAGAGISMEPPSNLASARKIMDTILKFISPDEDTYNKLKNIKDLRFEYVIELFRDNIDNDLRILDYFESAKTPNIIHKFLAEQMKKGNYVMTTNFDYLIEYAFGVEDPKLRVVISENDFRECADPHKVYVDGMVPLYKLHGCKKNIKTGEDTKKWVVSTLDALGKQKKKEGETFTVPLYQQDLFKNISKNKTLIILGYSGGDDFDIMPALRIMQSLRQIIWIEHIQNENNKEGLGLFKMGLLKSNAHDVRPKLNKRDKFLQQIINENQNIGIYVLKRNTAKILCNLALRNYKITQHPKGNNNILRIEEFLDANFDRPSDIERPFFCGVIFYNYNHFEDALFYWNEALRLLEDENDAKSDDLELDWRKKMLSIILGNMAIIYKQKGEFNKTLAYYEKSRRINEKYGHKLEMAIILGNMGLVYRDKGEPDKALELFQEAYNIFRSQGDLYKEAVMLENMGMIFRQKGITTKALELYNQAYKIAKNLGRLENMASISGNIAAVYADKGEVDKAMELYQEAYNIFKTLGDLQDMAAMLGNIASIYADKGEVDKAMELYRETYNIFKELGDPQNMAAILGDMGTIYAGRDELDKALELYQEAYEIFKSLSHLLNMAAMLGNMGLIYADKGELDTALEYHQKAYEINKKLGNKFGMATQLGNMGLIYADKGELDTALEYHQKAYEIDNELENKPGMAQDLGNIGTIYLKQDKDEEGFDAFLNCFILSYISQYNEGLEFAKGQLSQFFEGQDELEEFLKKTLDERTN